MGDDERTATAVGRAFSFHPGTWSGPVRAGNWIIGPTFAVYTPEGSYPQARAEEVRKLHEYLQLPALERTSISSRPHYVAGLKRTCKARKLGETSFELAYSLYALGRLVGANGYVISSVPDEGQRDPVVLTGTDEEGSTVAVFAARRMNNCGDEKEARPKKGKKRQGKVDA